MVAYYSRALNKAEKNYCITRQELLAVVEAVKHFHHYIYGVPTIVRTEGWSGGAKVLGKLTVPGRPTNLDYSRAWAYCACSRCGWGLFGHFFSHLSLLLSLSLSLGDGPI